MGLHQATHRQAPAVFDRSDGQGGGNGAAVAAERAVTRMHEKPHQLRSALDRLAEDFAPPEDADPGTWLVTWAIGKKSECAPSTAKTYLNTMESAAAWMSANGIRSFSALSGKHVTAMRDAWAAETSPGTANEKIKHLRIAFKAATLPPHKVLAENPATHIAPLATRQTARRGFRTAEWKVLLPVLHGEWKAMVFLALNTGGQRINDLAVLRHSAIDVAAKTVTFFAKKTDALVCLPLLDATVTALLTLPTSDNPNDFIFPRLAGLAESSRSNEFIAILASVGLARKKENWRTREKNKTSARSTSQLSFHSLRHTATSWLKSAGVSDSIARAIVGHESKAVSQAYTHIDMETMRTALEKLTLQ